MEDCYILDNYHNKIPYFFKVLDNCIVSDTIKQNSIWEPHLHWVFDRYVHKDSVVIECGCHIGAHTLKLASLCNTLYGFEPMPETYNTLCRNIQLNNITNARIIQQGVSDRVGLTKYCWIPHGNPGGSGLDNNPMGIPTWITPTDKQIDVTLTTIDSLHLERLDFMKIDVEGYETLVIKGSMDTIKRCKPVIVMEVWKNHYGQVDLEHTKTLFKDLLDSGYTVKHVYGPDFLFTPV